MQYSGHCTCGHVQYVLQSEPMAVHACHCTWCQRETGSAFALNALIERDRLVVTEGTTIDVDTPTESGKGQRIVRCSRCHVALWSHYGYGGIGELVAFVRVGTLANPGSLPPTVHIFTESKQPWLTLPSDVPVVARYYKAKEIWSEESLSRRAALYAQVEAQR